MTEVLEISAVLVAGPMVGTEFAVAAFTNPIVDRLPDDAFRVARSNGSRLLGRVMPFWYMTTLSLLIVAAIASRNWSIGTAVVLMGAVVLMTVTVMVPINNRIGAWSATGDVSRDLARRWDHLHWLRVLVLAALFGLLVVGAL